MLPTGLFVDSPEMNDISLQKLSPDCNVWPEEIIEKLKERIPQSNGLNLMVKFMKQDPETGAGTGSVLVSSTTKQVVVPVIVKDFMLYPLDIMIADQKLLPLTPDYFMAAFQQDQNNAFLRLEEYPMYSGMHRFDEGSMWNANYPPAQGRYSYASAGYEMLDKISGTIDGSQLKSYLLEHPEVAANLVKHGHAEIIKNLAKLDKKAAFGGDIKALGERDGHNGKKRLVLGWIPKEEEAGPRGLLKDTNELCGWAAAHGYGESVQKDLMDVHLGYVKKLHNTYGPEHKETKRLRAKSLQYLKDIVSNKGREKKAEIGPMAAVGAALGSVHASLKNDPEKSRIQRVGHFLADMMHGAALGAISGQIMKKAEIGNIALLRSAGPSRYSILSTQDDVFSPVEQSWHANEIRKMLADLKLNVDEVMNDVALNGERVLIMPEAGPGPMGGIKSTEAVVSQANEFGPYQVQKRDGVMVEGFVIPKVIGFDMKPMSAKVFLGESMGTIQSDIAGVKLPATKVKLRHHPIRVGSTGVFVMMGGDKKSALCTAPVTIKSVEDKYGEVKMRVMSLDGQGMALKLASHANVPHASSDRPGQIFEGFQRIVKVADGYILPNKFFWVPMEGFHEVSERPEEFQQKLAAQTTSSSNVTIIPTGYGQWAIRGAEKLAQEAKLDPTLLSQGQVQFLLASMGCGSEKIASVIKSANRKGKEVVSVTFPKLASHYEGRKQVALSKIAAKCDQIRVNLVKEASYIDNAQTVDALLALNFVNPDNLSKFVGFLPRIKATISNLCSLMLASRLGVQEIPEQAASTAMYRLIDVVNGLESVRASLEGGAQNG